MLNTGGHDPPNVALPPPQSGGEPLVRPARGPVFVLLGADLPGAGAAPIWRGSVMRGRIHRRLPLLATSALTLLVVAGLTLPACGSGTDILALDVKASPAVVVDRGLGLVILIAAFAGCALLLTAVMFWAAAQRRVPVAEVAGKESAARRRGLRLRGAVLMLAGGLTLVVATFLNWLHDGTVVTGWELYDVQSRAGENLWVIGDMFSPGTLLFTGLTTLVGGIVVIVLALVALALPISKQSPNFPMRPVLGAPLLFAVFFIFLLGTFNAFETAVKEAGPGGSIGLVLCVAASFVAFLGAVVATVGANPNSQSAGLIGE